MRSRHRPDARGSGVGYISASRGGRVLTPATTERSPNRRVVAAFIVLVLLIGTNLVAIRYTNRELAPFWNAGFRFVLAAIGFAIIFVVRRPGAPPRRALIGGTLYGLLSFAGFFGFIYLGLVRAPAAIGQTVLALNPLATMFAAAAIGMEWLR